MTIKEIQATLEEGQSLKQIAQVYSEIANLKIKRIRAQTERNRLFFQEITKIYAIIKKFAARKGINPIKPKKRVSIVLTSNHKFYGRINEDLLKFFIDTTKLLNTDYVFLGKASIDHFKNQPLKQNFKEVVLKDDQPDAQELVSLVNMLNDYNQILVFYSSFKSLLIQVPIVTDLTATSTSSANPSESEKFEFIFEPDLPKILHFFDSQVLTVLLESTFLESELARTAARFISMDKAETEANKFIKEYQGLESYAKRSKANDALLENFAAMIVQRKAGMN